MMKIIYSLFFILLLSLPFYGQNRFLPLDFVNILQEKFPTFRYDTEWDYEKSVKNSPAHIADWNDDGKPDYGVFIEFAGQKKFAVYLSSESGYKFSVIERDTVLAFNSKLLETVRTYKNNMEEKFIKHLPKSFNIPKDAFGLKILKEYGALYVARRDAVLPKNVIFKNHEEVSDFQSRLNISRETIGRFDIELQSVAMSALKNAMLEAGKENLTITTRDYDSGRRSYGETVGLWYSRVIPALEYWSENGRISAADAERLQTTPLPKQIPEIFKLEEDGIFFSKDMSKPIMYSVAPPGTSQHLSMLAIDINEFDNPVIQIILGRNGWHQTVISDLPHFTYLGATEPELPAMGLKKVISGGRFYWVPNL